MRGEIPFPDLSPSQQRWWYTTKRNILVVGGRRRGKSMAGRLYATKEAASGGLALWVSGNTKTAEDSWKDLADYLEPYASRFAPEDKGVIVLEGGGEVRRVSAASALSGRGPTPKIVVVDECQTVPWGFFKRAFPAMAVNGGRMILMGTPPDSAAQLRQAQWLRRMLDEPDKFPEWLIDDGPTSPEDMAFMMLKNNHPKAKGRPWAQALIAAQEELETQRTTLGDETFDREFGAQWIISTTGRVLKEFTTHNSTEQFDYDPNEGDVYWFMDRGEGAAHTVCLWAQVMLSQPGLRVFGEKFEIEIVEEDDFIDQCLEYSAEMGWPLPRLAVYDVRAPRYKQALFRKKIQSFGRNRSVDSGIKLLNSGFRKKWVNFHSRCTHLRTEMMKWEVKGNGDPSDRNRDGADALRYGYEYLIDKFGPHWRKLVKADDLQALQRTSLDTVFTFSWV